MPGHLNLASGGTPIAIPNVRTMDLVGKVQVDETVGELVCVVQTSLGGGAVYSTHTLTIHNGDAQGVRAKASPTGPLDYVETFLTTTGVATAFTDAYAAFKSGGRAALMTALQTAGLLPAGAVT